MAPPVEWMGKFAYKASYQIRAGRAEAIEITPFRGADRETNRVLMEALQKHVAEQYRCSGPEQRYEEYLVLTLGHELPALAAELEAYRARMTEWKARRAAASAPLKEADPLRLLCPKKQYPDVPATASPVRIELHAIAEVRKGAVVLVDIRIKMGSADSKVNRTYMNIVSRTISEGYQCSGDGVFEQEFEFRVS